MNADNRLKLSHISSLPRVQHGGQSESLCERNYGVEEGGGVELSAEPSTVVVC